MLSRLDRDARVICVFTFSKILSPGLRLGWVVADPEIVSRLVVAKQSVDLSASGLSQLVAREYLGSGRMPAQVNRLRALYTSKWQALVAALATQLDPGAGVSWTLPEGGLFLWLTGPSWLDASRLLERTLERDVAFVAGRPFHCDGSGRNTFRLNFSYPSEEQLRLAASALADCIAALAPVRT
jgi:2-aminoadipate transaminase